VRLILWLAAVSFFADVLSLILMSNRINSWPVINLFLLAQFILLFKVLEEHGNFFPLKVLFFSCVIFGLINYFFLQAPKTLNLYTVYACGLTMIILGVGTVFQMMRKLPTENIQSLPLFWLTFGVLVYYGGTLFIFLFNNYLINHSPQIHRNTWVLHNLLNIVKNIFFFATVWTSCKSQTSPS
jgi:hypothetical protein